MGEILNAIYEADFLGFCGTNRQGSYLILRHTNLAAPAEQASADQRDGKQMMHRTIAEQGLYLRRVLNGFFNYFAVPTNSRAINVFYYKVAWY